jgi:hypothetical protein
MLGLPFEFSGNLQAIATCTRQSQCNIQMSGSLPAAQTEQQLTTLDRRRRLALNTELFEA